MKKIRNLLLFVCLLISLGLFTSCKKKVETSGTGYGIVHKNYVGVASIKVKDEKVTSLSFEEVYLLKTGHKLVIVLMKIYILRRLVLMVK